MSYTRTNYRLQGNRIDMEANIPVGAGTASVYMQDFASASGQIFISGATIFIGVGSGSGVLVQTVASTDTTAL